MPATDTFTDTHAARAAFLILQHPGSLRFDRVTVAHLSLIESRGMPEASDAEWALLHECHDAVLLAEGAVS